MEMTQAKYPLNHPPHRDCSLGGGCSFKLHDSQLLKTIWVCHRCHHPRVVYK